LPQQLIFPSGAELGCQRVTAPFQDQTAVVDGTTDDPPLIGQRVAENAPLLVHGWPLYHHPQRPTGPNRAGRHARTDRAQAKIGQRTIACTHNH